MQIVSIIQGELTIRCKWNFEKKRVNERKINYIEGGNKEMKKIITHTTRYIDFCSSTINNTSSL